MIRVSLIVIFALSLAACAGQPQQAELPADTTQPTTAPIATARPTATVRRLEAAATPLATRLPSPEPPTAEPIQAATSTPAAPTIQEYPVPPGSRPTV